MHVTGIAMCSTIAVLCVLTAVHSTLRIKKSYVKRLQFSAIIVGASYDNSTSQHTCLFQEQLLLALKAARVLLVLPDSLLQASHIPRNSAPEHIAQPLHLTAIPANTTF